MKFSDVKTYRRIGQEEGDLLAYPPKNLASGCSSGHRASDLAEDGADAGGNTRHDCARGNRDETRH